LFTWGVLFWYSLRNGEWFMKIEDMDKKLLIGMMFFAWLFGVCE